MAETEGRNDTAIATPSASTGGDLAKKKPSIAPFASNPSMK